ncbi:30S ribosome-binding factor RbfA [Enterobacteriaceae endosymbiont of Macroplea appendiculata]|uniref:30S ribosome-binding factor RbfA n=1 Tax=Enterobacteriaceae endosymbiont of Macroplea appendiculata TaxID=2675790 RepID=UPI001448C5F5|nr:30S ribosome-binding factor RbfA [Enterobacteriaceae endosymbiont of Macroplea appendiculata]QJC30914.1 30S ribosome-binding factor RbfA [Enterobacteriaceae endosymbiont of Macroplea appendiculata]
MEKNKYRQLKVANELKKQISYILANNIHDTRFNKLITVTDLLVTKDLSYAQIFICYPQTKNILQHNEKQELYFLNTISGYIKHILTQKIILRHIPHLKFFFDHSLNVGAHITKLLNQNNI